MGPEPAQRGDVLPLPPLLSLAGGTPLVGRESTWRSLEAAWAAAAGGARQVVLLPGDVGAGKTRLITEFARRVHAGGGAVLFGTCGEGQTVPYQPFAEALGHVLAALGPTSSIDRFGDDAVELGRLLPRHGTALGAPVAVGDGDPDTERARLFDAVVGVIREVARRQPVLLALDDLHWATRPTIDVLLQLVRDQQLTDVVVVAAYRSAPADIEEPLRYALPALRRAPGVSRVAVGGLDRDGIRNFVAAAIGRPAAAADELEATVDELARQTDGNAFLLVELWQHLVDSGRVTSSAGRWSVRTPLDAAGSPDGVREVVSGRLDRLAPTTRRLLEMASVVGPTFDATVVATLADLPISDVLDGLEAATRSRMIGEFGSAGYRFGHELIRRCVYDDLANADRRALHLAIARSLAAAPDGAPAGEIAHHLAAAVPLVDRSDAVAAALAAASAATRAVAHDDAVRYFEMALELGPDDRVALLLRTADAMMRAGDVERAKARCLEAFRSAEEVGDDRHRIDAALAFSEACWRDSRDARTAAELLRRVLAVAGDDGTRMLLHASLTRALALSGDGEAARVLGDDVLASARHLQDLEARRLAFDAISYVPWTPQSLEHQLGAMREATAAAQAAGDLEWENHATCKSLYGEILAGDLDAARASAARHHELATRIGQPLFHALDCQAQALLAIGEGRFAAAERLAAEADELGQALSGAPSGGYGVQLFAIRREQGRLDEARPIVEAVAQLDRAGATWRPALAVMYAELGMDDEAGAELDVLTANGLALVPRDALWLGSLSFLADACCLVGHRRGAAAVYEQLVAWRGRVVQVGHLLAAHGAVDRYLGELAALLDHQPEAAIHLAAALRSDTAARMPVWVAHSQLAQGRFLLGSGRPDDVDAGRALLLEAQATAARLGMPTVAAHAMRALAGEPERPHDRAVGLTERELDVLGLVAEGRSNRDIGRCLHISQHTAANHIRSILMKTDCANRTEAAAWALRHGVPSAVNPSAS